MPAPSKVDSWISPKNQKLLVVQWESLPEFKGTKRPDGTTDAPRAPWPFLIYVKGADSKESGKIQTLVLNDTRVALASHAVKFTQSSPDRALDLPYLKAVSGIKDPSLLVVDRDFKIVGIVNEWKNFDDKGLLPLLVKAADAAYPVKLGAYIGGLVEQMQVGEGLWKKEQRIAELQNKAGKANDVKQKALDDECDKLEKEIAAGQVEMDKQVDAIRATLVAKEAEAAPLPTTVGSGKNKRKLTPQELEAIESFRGFAKNDNPLVRAAAVEDLGAIDSAAMVEIILGACSDVDDRVIDAAGRGLGKMASDEALLAMIAGLDHGNAKARAAAAFGFARVKRPYPAAVPKLAGLVRSGDDDVRRAAVQALANMKDPATTDALIEALNDRIPALRILAAQALGALRQEKSVPGLVAQLTADDWVMKKAAAEALARVRSRDSIEPLIARMEAESGVMTDVLYHALVDVTGEDHSYEARHWRRWWDQAKAGFKLPTDDEVEKAKRRAADAMAQYKSPEKKTYHSIETLSKRMIFVIDVSSSMGDKIAVPDTATQEQIDAFGSRVKMDIAKNELIALLGTLPDDVEFNIITFAGSPKPWQNGLVGAGMRTSAIKFVSKLQPLQAPSGNSGRANAVATGSDEQKTNTYAAILAAFGFADEGSPDWKKRGKVDTVFFVTDGLPTTGQIVDVPRLIDTVTDMNRTRGLTIHLIIFDKNAAERLKGLAEKNGGKCVVRTFETK